MRIFILGAAILASCCLSNAQANTRQVDFKNFTFPLSGPLLGHAELKWLGQTEDGSSKRKPIHLVHGRDGEGFSLESVAFADVTGNANEDAIVVLRYDTGGTQYTHYIYVYSFEDGRPQLLAYCHTGDWSEFGLYKVYLDHGELVFELLDPQKSQGLCCSRRFIRKRYKWDGKRFVRTGNLEYGPAELIVIPDK
jgi:hypothetical protein